jgi:hypothetical protein
MFLISFVFWEFGWQSYSTLYGMIIAFGVPDNAILNSIVQIALVPVALYFGFKVVTQEIVRRAEKRKQAEKELAKKSPSPK